MLDFLKNNKSEILWGLGGFVVGFVLMWAIMQAVTWGSPVLGLFLGGIFALVGPMSGYGSHR